MKQLLINSISLEELYRKIYEYQTTRDPDIYFDILLKLDKFVIYLLRKISWFSWLKNQPSQDLYGEALIGLHNGVLALPTTWTDRNSKVYLFLGTYIKNQLRNKYKFNLHEVNVHDIYGSEFENAIEGEEEDWNKASQDNVFHQYDLAVRQHSKDKAIIEVSLLLKTPGLLNERELKIVKLSYLEGLDGVQVGKKLGYSKQRISDELRRIIKKIRDYVQQDKI